MIKPFIRGITDLEANEIADILTEYEVRQCVVGDLLLDNRVKDKLSSTGVLINTKTDITNRQILDCTSGESYEVNTSSDMNDFCNLHNKYNKIYFSKQLCQSYIISLVQKYKG